MITEDYVSFETAKLLKEKGFDEITFTWYTGKGKFCVGKNNFDDYHVNHLSNMATARDKNKCSAPTLQMAMKWLREVHKIGIFPTTFYRHTKTFDGHNYGCTLVNLKTFDVIGNFEDSTFPADSYEQTCELAIKYCLDHLHEWSMHF